MHAEFGEDVLELFPGDVASAVRIHFHELLPQVLPHVINLSVMKAEIMQRRVGITLHSFQSHLYAIAENGNGHFELKTETKSHQTTVP